VEDVTLTTWHWERLPASNHASGHHRVMKNRGWRQERGSGSTPFDAGELVPQAEPVDWKASQTVALPTQEYAG
jgi:hypothetical protein